MIYFCLAFALLLPCVAGAQDRPCGRRHLVTVETDGSSSRGSKERLRRAVRDGLSIRVGWSVDANADGTPDVAHWVAVPFVTEFENEIFAQLDDIQRQAPVRGEARVSMPAGRQRWTGVIGSNGRLESHFDDGSEPGMVRVRSTWCKAP